jgi:hypothetical protein
MKKLEEDWLTKGLIDFEYKKYILLDYLQHIKEQFKERRLYPFLSDLVFHYNHLLTIEEQKKVIKEAFPKRITKADFKKLEFTYQKLVEEEEIMEELKAIIEFALSKIKEPLKEGKEIYEYVESGIEFSPVGLEPLRLEEGYLFISEENLPQFKVYRYMMTVFQNAMESFRGIHTHFIGDYIRSIHRTFENVKGELVRTFTELPNPATYLVHSKVIVPHQETLLPIAKRMLVRHVSVNPKN